MCDVAGISRQAYYKGSISREKQLLTASIVVALALTERKKHTRMGCKKIYHKIKSDLVKAGIKIGRNKFIDLLVEHGLHVKPRRGYHQTTQSNHSFGYAANLLKTRTITAINQAWVSDITYLRTNTGFLYLFLVTDLFSRKILGYNIANTLEIKHGIKAYKMALTNSNNKGTEIHHSDRGIHYSCAEFRTMLKENNTSLSMTRGGAPHENAVAERVNGILKTEYLISDKKQSPKDCKRLVKQAIKLYNNDRPHWNLNFKTPSEVYNN